MTALAFTRTGFPRAGDDPSDIAGGYDLAMHFIGENPERVISGRQQTIIGMFNVQRFPVGRVNRIGLEWNRAL
jgi:hypothetical protein